MIDPSLRSAIAAAIKAHPHGGDRSAIMAALAALILELLTEALPAERKYLAEAFERTLCAMTATTPALGGARDGATRQ